MKESAIAYETPNGRAWVHEDRKQRAYVVFRTRVCYSEHDSGYPLTVDGLTLAKARADYLAR